MRLKTVLTLSLLLNLILGWMFLARQGDFPESPSNRAPLALVISVTNGSAPAGGGASHAGMERAQISTPPLRWQQVESPDYRQYLANLRAVGCPERTIRDIVTADVSELFAERAAAVTRTNEYRYWRGVALTRTPEQEEQLKQLLMQKQAVLETLGFPVPDPSQLVADFMRDTLQDREAEIAFLPDGLRHEVRDTLFRAAQRALVDGGDAERNAALERETDQQLRALLGDEEFNEYELRASTDAHVLRGALDPLELSETEFREVFAAWRDLKGHAPGTPEHRQTRQYHESALRELLGPERFERYLVGVRQWGYPD